MCYYSRRQGETSATVAQAIPPLSLCTARPQYVSTARVFAAAGIRARPVTLNAREPLFLLSLRPRPGGPAPVCNQPLAPPSKLAVLRSSVSAGPAVVSDTPLIILVVL
jgi:hypothetical protein